MHMPAATDGLHGVMLGDLKSQHGQIKDLTCFAHMGKGQFPLARLAPVWHVVGNYSVGLGALAQGAANMTFLSASWLLTRNPQGFWSGFVQAVTRWRLAGVLAVERQSTFELLDALLHYRHLCHQVLHLLLQGPQHLDQLVLLRVAELCEVGQVWHQG
jgi:hypothetical protein